MHHPIPKHRLLSLLAALLLSLPVAAVAASGGHASGSDYIGGANSTALTGNNVTVGAGDTYRNVSGGSNGIGDVSNNTVTMSGGTVGNDVFGGQGSGIVTGNRVTLSAGVITNSVYGGYGSNDKVSDNHVVISGGEVNMAGSSNCNITGGYGEGEVSGNSMTISGGKVNGNIYGGYGVDANNNSVTIAGSPTFGNEAFLFGGMGTVSTGNTLNIQTWGVKVTGVSHFQHYNFYLPTQGQVALEVTGASSVIKSTDTIKIGDTQPGGKYNVGDTATLIKGAGNVAWNGQTGQVKQGLSLVYDYKLDATASKVGVTITGSNVNPKTEAVTTGQAAGMAGLNMAGDLAAGKGLDNAVSALGSAASAVGSAASSGMTGKSGGSAARSVYGIVPFAAVQGGGWYSNVGNGAYMDGTGMLAGLAKRWEGSSVEFILGGFFEASQSHVRSSSGDFSATSKNTALGGGVLARLELSDTALRGLYAEGSFRMGSLRQQWSGESGDLVARTASYDKETAYYGAHGGLGYVWSINDSLDLDLYGKYFWNRQQGFDVRVAGDKFSFDDADSHRVRGGARLKYAVNDVVKPYVGVAWEHEFDGKSRATTYGLDLPSPNATGGTGVGQIGLEIKPADSGFFINLDVQGYVGQRQGALGTVVMGYDF